MSRTIHLCVSVRGMLNWSKAEMRRMASSITVDGVPLRTADQVRDFLLDQLSIGHEVLPMAECDNFDYKTGCKGHEVPSEERDERI